MSVYEDIKTGLEQAIAYEKENNIKKEKAILIIDMPESCKNCMCYVLGAINNFCEVTRFAIFDNTTKPDWCPLKPVPKKLEGNDSIYYQWGDYEDGWNHCIDSLIDE